MSYPKVFTRYTVPQAKGSLNTKPSETVLGSYVPARQQIESFMLAGVSLEMLRMRQNGAYDFDGSETDEQIDVFDDVTRSPEYDAADAAQDAIQVQSRYQKAVAARNAAIEAEKRRNAEKLKAEQVETSESSAAE